MAFNTVQNYRNKNSQPSQQKQAVHTYTSNMQRSSTKLSAPSRSITNYQDAFLNSARTSGAVVKIFTTNGFQMSGKIVAYDSFVIIFQEIVNNKPTGAQQLIYKHAISTIRPDVQLDLRRK